MAETEKQNSPNIEMDNNSEDEFQFDPSDWMVLDDDDDEDNILDESPKELAAFEKISDEEIVSCSNSASDVESVETSKKVTAHIAKEVPTAQTALLSDKTKGKNVVDCGNVKDSVSKKNEKTSVVGKNSASKDKGNQQSSNSRKATPSTDAKSSLSSSLQPNKKPALKAVGDKATSGPTKSSTPMKNAQQSTKKQPTSMAEVFAEVELKNEKESSLRKNTSGSRTVVKEKPKTAVKRPAETPSKSPSTTPSKVAKTSVSDNSKNSSGAITSKKPSFVEINPLKEVSSLTPKVSKEKGPLSSKSTNQASSGHSFFQSNKETDQPKISNKETIQSTASNKTTSNPLTKSLSVSKCESKDSAVNKGKAGDFNISPGKAKILNSSTKSVQDSEKCFQANSKDNEKKDGQGSEGRTVCTADAKRDEAFTGEKKKAVTGKDDQPIKTLTVTGLKERAVGVQSAEIPATFSGNKPEVKTAETLKEGNTKKDSEENVPQTAALKKRIIRRFHRATQTITPQFSNKLLQCLIKIPSIDYPKRPANEIGLQVVEERATVNSLPPPIIIVKPDTVPQDIFHLAQSFGRDEMIKQKADKVSNRYGIRITNVKPGDLVKTKKFSETAESYAISFTSKDAGYLDFWFHDEQELVTLFHFIRKKKFESQFICVTVVILFGKEERKKNADIKHSSATVVFDQNSSTCQFIEWQKATPFSGKTKPLVFVSVHNIPPGIPLSFLKLIFPDAITLEMDDPSITVTKTICRARLAMPRNVMNKFLTLFNQIVMNGNRLYVTSGLKREEDLPEMKEVLQERKKREEALKIEKSYQSVKAVARDINATTTAKEHKNGEEEVIVMQVEDVESLDTVLTGRSGAWKGPSTVDSLSETKGPIDPKTFAQDSKNSELSDVSDNSDFGEEKPEKEKYKKPGGKSRSYRSPENLNQWRHTRPLKIMKTSNLHSDDGQRRYERPQEDSPSMNRHMSGSYPKRPVPQRIDPPLDRHRENPPERRDDRVRPEHRRSISSRERFLEKTGRERDSSERNLDRREVESYHHVEKDSHVSRDRDHGRKWPDLKDADFDDRHRVIVPQKVGRRGSSPVGSKEGDLRPILEDLKSRRSRDRDRWRRSPAGRSSCERIPPTAQRRSKSRDWSPAARKRPMRKSPSPVAGSHRSREVHIRNNRLRSPVSLERDRRIVRRSISPPRRPSSERHNPDFYNKPQHGKRQEKPKRSLSPPVRKIGITAKDLALKEDNEKMTKNATEEWKAMWAENQDEEKPARGEKRSLSAEPQEENIAVSKTLYNTLMNHLKERAKVSKKSSEDSSLVGAAKAYSEINQLAETLTAIVNEKGNSAKSHDSQSREKASTPASTSASAHKSRDSSGEGLLNYFKPGKSLPSTSSSSSLTSATSTMPLSTSTTISHHRQGLMDNNVHKELHPDLLCYVKAGIQSSSIPPPIPPPIAPPLFTSSSPIDKKAQLEAIAKQLATEILSHNPGQGESSPSDGTWLAPPPEGLAPPPEEVKKALVGPAPVQVLNPPPMPNLATAPPPVMFGGPPMTVGGGQMNTSLPPPPNPFFPMGLQPVGPMPVMSFPNMMPPGMWNPQQGFPPMGGNQ